MAQENYIVGNRAPQGLFLRTEPVVNESTKIAVLPMGKEVEKLAESSTPGWWQVSTNLQGSDITGFVNSRFLVKVRDFVEPDTVSSISSVHLQRSSDVTRKNKAWAFALNEDGQPTRDSATSATEQAGALTDIVGWLNVENVRHLRYQPIPSATYCNIYAYDYCYLAGVYLPRVWWTSRALIDLAAGRNVQPIYGQTVHEMNANSLFVWLEDFGPTFGWRRTASLDEMQNAANNGQAVTICAQNRIPNRSGHIVMVVPETNANNAERRNGAVTKPLQSQAGRTNYKYRIDLWWIRLASTFREHGFWINAS
jgi:Bacterial SH3 domain